LYLLYGDNALYDRRKTKKYQKQEAMILLETLFLANGFPDGNK